MIYSIGNEYFEGTVLEILSLREILLKVDKTSTNTNPDFTKCKRCGDTDIEYSKHVYWDDKKGKYFRIHCHCNRCNNYYFVPMVKETVDITRSQKWVNSKSYQEHLDKRK